MQPRQVRFRRTGVLATLLAVWLVGATSAMAIPMPVTIVPNVPGLQNKTLGPATPPAIAAEPRLEPADGQHGTAVSSFNGMALDKEGRRFALVRNDNTVVIRAVDDSEYPIVFRPPLGDGPETFLNSVAFAPQGDSIAVGWSSGKAAAIFIVDRTNANIVHRIDGLVDVATDIRFSQDGKLLAVSLVSGGVQVFDLPSYREIGRDLDYGGNSYSVDISRDGRFLVTTCSDKLVRLYSLASGRLNRISVSEPNGRWSAPAVARFSPDNTLLAIGLERGSGVEIWKTETLKKISDLFFISALSNSPALVWSTDGRQIYAPSVNAKTDFKIRIWTAGQPGRSGDEGFNVGAHAIDLHFDGHGVPRGFAPLPDSRLLAATGLGHWGFATPDGKVAWQGGAGTFRFHDYAIDTSKAPPLGLSDDGRIVQFPYSGYKDLVTFDTTKLAISPATPPLPLAATRGVRDLEVKITGIFGLADAGKRATLNGREFDLPPKELVVSFALSPDGQFVALTSSTSVRVFTKDGRLIWTRDGGALSVNISRDGKLVVADDGIIRWFRATDGTLLLSLLPSADRVHWIAWTPSGYFEASPGGEDMVEWRVNRGLNQPSDVYPLSRFADAMRRPDIVSKALETLDEDRAVQLADAAAGRTGLSRADAFAAETPAPVKIASTPGSPPKSGHKSVVKAAATASCAPAGRRRAQGGCEAEGKPPSAAATTGPATPAVGVAQILPPVIDPVSVPTAFSSDQVAIVYRIRAPADAPMIGEPRVLANGHWQSRSRAANQISPGARTVVVTGLPPRDSIVEIFADNRNGTSVPLRVPLRWTGQSGIGNAGSSASLTAPSHKPRLFVLAIGVSQYARDDLKLTYADHDAEQVAKAMAAQQGKAYASVSTRLITNAEAGRQSVMKGLSWLSTQVAADDVGLVFIAGHGFETSDGAYFFAPADFDPGRPRETGVDYISIRKALVEFEAKGNRAIFLIDTCYSGGAMGANTVASSGEAFGRSLGTEQYSMVGLTSSTGRQASQEKVEWGDGAFTKALIEGIVQGRADAAQTGEVTILNLGGYVSQRVKGLTNQTQTPVFIAPQAGLQDFAIADH